MTKEIKKPSVCTILYWLIQDKKIEAELLFDFLNLFWPEFIIKDDYIFLKEKFSDQEYNLLIQDGANPEYWINLLTIDELFSEMDDWEESSSSFAKALISMWTAKLKNEFPDVNFTVEYLHNEEFGDYGLTFYQTSNDNIGALNNEAQEILTPHVKENALEQSSSGPRQGIPFIRRARDEEIPQEL